MPPLRCSRSEAHEAKPPKRSPVAEIPIEASCLSVVPWDTVPRGADSQSYSLQKLSPSLARMRTLASLTI